MKSLKEEVLVILNRVQSHKGMKGLISIHSICQFIPVGKRDAFSKKHQSVVNEVKHILKELDVEEFRLITADYGSTVTLYRLNVALNFNGVVTDQELMNERSETE